MAGRKFDRVGTTLIGVKRELRNEVPEIRGGLNGSLQHWLGVYWPEFQSPKFLADVDLGAGLPC